MPHTVFFIRFYLLFFLLPCVFSEVQFGMDLRSQSMAPSPSSPCIQSAAHNSRTNDPLSFDFLTEPFMDAHHKSAPNVDTNFFLPTTGVSTSAAGLVSSSTTQPIPLQQHAPSHNDHSAAHVSHIPTSSHLYHSSNQLVYPRSRSHHDMFQHSHLSSHPAPHTGMQSPVRHGRMRHSHRVKSDMVMQSSPTSTLPGHLSNRSSSPVGNVDLPSNVDITNTMDTTPNVHQLSHQSQHYPNQSYNQLPLSTPVPAPPAANNIGSTTGSSSTDDLFADPVSLYASLYSPNAPNLSKSERRRLRILLRARRCRRTRGVPARENQPQGALSSPRSNGCTASTINGRTNVISSASAASIKDKKAARVIRNREVALRARQMAKLKMKNLESENCSLKNRASTLESENITLRSYVQRLTGGRGGPLPLPLVQGERLQQGQWSHDGVTLDGGVVGGVSP